LSQTAAKALAKIIERLTARLFAAPLSSRRAARWRSNCGCLLRGQAANPQPVAGQARASRSTLLTDFNLALAREVCRRLRARCEYSYAPFAEIIPGIESKRFELGFGNHLRTAAREAQVAFSNPLWRSSSRLLAFPGTAALRMARHSTGELTIQTLREVRVATVRGSQQHAYLQRVAKTQDLELIDLATVGDCLLALDNQEADFAFLPTLIAYLALDARVRPTPSFVGPGLVADGLGGSVHIVLARTDEKLRQQLNLALDEMRQDGSYPRLWRRYFPFDMY
jgi:histidine transport system substrate-binding protein